MPPRQRPASGRQPHPQRAHWLGRFFVQPSVSFASGDGPCDLEERQRDPTILCRGAPPHTRQAPRQLMTTDPPPEEFCFGTAHGRKCTKPVHRGRSLFQLYAVSGRLDGPTERPPAASPSRYPGFQSIPSSSAGREVVELPAPDDTQVEAILGRAGEGPHLPALGGAPLRPPAAPARSGRSRPACGGPWVVVVRSLKLVGVRVALCFPDASSL